MQQQPTIPTRSVHFVKQASVGKVGANAETKGEISGKRREKEGPVTGLVVQRF